jgi:hypothetical protein
MRSPRAVSQSARSNGTSAIRSSSKQTVQATPRTNHEVTVSTSSNTIGHQSRTTPAERPPAMDLERKSRTTR